MESVSARSYWLDLFTWATWQEFLNAGGEISGFRESRWKTVQQIRPGDYLLCYLTGVSRWIGVLEAVSPAFEDQTRIWKDEVFPSRIKVRLVVRLSPETAVPVLELRELLTVFRNLKGSGPSSWTGWLRGSPRRLTQKDGEAIVSAIREAEWNPVKRVFDATKLSYRPRTLKAKLVGEVTIPEREEPPEESERKAIPATQLGREATEHDHIQALLLNLGSDMGLEAWVARNDRGKEVGGQKLADVPGLKKELPHQFDEATNRTVELIDVLWLKGNAIVAAFEIESTTSIYSGLLRMSDLIAMQPNLKIPLYLVAPDERRDKVVTEVNRPTFSRLSPPMNTMCRFIPFSTLRDRISQVGSLVRYLKPDFLDELSESCQIVGA